ncbi:MAG: carboxypeptidase-like regulatory domain-containing protein [Candidatus Diapherotrites archaeon]
MGLSEIVGGVYAKIEGTFYAVMDSLELKGIPVYNVIEPLEKRGIPAFPVFIAALVLIIALIFGLFVIGTTTDVSLSLRLVDDAGKGLSGVSVSAVGPDGKAFALPKPLYSDGATISLAGIPIGAEITLTGEKEGYESGTGTVQFKGGKTATASISLKKHVNAIIGTLKLVDSDSRASVDDARVSVLFEGGQEVNCPFRDENKFYACAGVNDGETYQVKVSSSNYEDKTIAHSFVNGSVAEITMVPKSPGQFSAANLIVRIRDAETNELVPGAKIELFDAQDNTVISSVTDDDGEYIEQEISTGTTLRLVVSKDGYVKYDSGAKGTSRTIRGEEEIWDVQLIRGGKAVLVSVVDKDSTFPKQNAKVMLFNSNAELIDSNVTGFSGTVEFAGLDPNETYAVTAYADRYLPARQEFTTAATTEIQLVLEALTAQNSASFSATVVDFSSFAVNDATLNFFELLGGRKLPLGLPSQKTDLSGRYLGVAKKGINLLVEASKGPATGDDNKMIGDELNDLLIQLQRPEGIVWLTLVDALGNPVTDGRVLIESGSGAELFDGNASADGIFFDAQGNKFAKLTYTSPDGKVFTEEINLEGEGEITVTIQEGEVPGLSPKVSFIGVFNIQGEQVQGLTKGNDYYLKFETVWPKGDFMRGLHVRIGKDSVKYADSEDAGITGFSATGVSGFFYGRTYSPFPEPGYESVDYSNSGEAGEYNKWLELYFGQSAETRIVKVKVKAKETAEASDVELHYRAWAQIGGSYYRSPEDQTILLSAYSAEKSGLYAETTIARLKIFASEAKCKNDLCTSFKFIKADGSEFLPEEFKAVQGELYALEIELNPLKSVEATVKASTSKTNPKIAFQGYGVESFAEFPDNNKTDTSIEITSLAVEESESLKARIYFKALALENTFITAQIVTAEDAITQNLYFNIYLEKNLEVKIRPETVELGKDFSITVADEQGNGVNNAQLKLYAPSGELSQTIIGDGRKGSGESGVYDITNSFDPGTVKLELKAEGFKPLSREISVTKGGVLQLPQEIRILIPKADKSALKSIELVNTSDELIQDVTVELQKKANFPQEMLVNPLPPAMIERNSTLDMEIDAEYTGKKESAHAEATMIVRGRVLGKYSVSAETKLILDYNPALDSGCLEFSKGALSALILDEQSSSQEISFTAKNNCELDLVLKPEVVASGTKDDNIKVDVGEIRLGAAGSEGSTQEVIVSVVNLINRNMPQKKTVKYDLFFKSDSLTKSVPLEVMVWNRLFALEMTRNIELWIADTGTGQAAAAQLPLFIRNSGEADVENISFSVSAAYSAGTTQVTVVSPNSTTTDIPLLKKGETVVPPRFVFAKALQTEKSTIADVSQIEVRGTINGKQYDFGPITVTTHISSPKCVLVTPTNIEFISAKTSFGQLSQGIRVKNNCTEEVRVADINPKVFGSNVLMLLPFGATVSPGRELPLQLVLTKREDWQAQQPLYLNLFLVRSNQWLVSQPIQMNLQLGEKGIGDKKASYQEELPVCSDNGSKEKKLVSFPRIATGAGCSDAYCDAEQLAEFLSDKIDAKVKDAKNTVGRYNGEILNTPCDKESIYGGFCSFDQLGVKTETFFVYFMNDNLSADMMESVLDKKSSLGSYRVDFIGSGSNIANAGSLLGGYGGQILFTAPFQGCGRYTVKINGAVKVQGNALIPDIMNVLVEVTGDETGAREITEQCENKIQNVNNFLPIDKSYSSANSNDSWLAMVSADEESLQPLGQTVAKSLFGKDDRFSSMASQRTNTLNLILGSEENYLVKLEMEREGGAEPKTINAYIKESVGTETADGTAKIQDAIAKEAATAIAQIKSGQIDGCISADDDYLLIKSTSKVAKIALTGCAQGHLPVVFGEPSCCDFNVSSELKERVSVEALLKDTRQGTGEPWIQTKAGEKTDEVELTLAEDEKSFNAELKLCIEGEQDLQLAQGKKVQLKAKSAADGGRKAEEKEVEMQVCGIHPYSLLEQLNEKAKAFDSAKPKDYYATLVWKGDPDTIKLSDLVKLNAWKENLAKAEQIVSGSGSPSAKGFKDWISSNEELVSITAYAVGCGATSIMLGIWKGGVGGFVDAALNCGLPAAWAYMGLTEGGKKMQDWVKSTLGGLWDTIKSTAGAIGSVLGIKKDNRTFNDLIEGEIAGVSTYALKHGIQESAGVVGELTARSAAEQVAHNIADQVMSQNIQGWTASLYTPKYIAPDLRNTFQNALEKKIVDKLRPSFGSGKKISDVLTQDLVNSALSEVGTDEKLAGLLLNSQNLTTDGKDTLKKLRTATIKETINSEELSKAVSQDLTFQDMRIRQTPLSAKETEKILENFAKTKSDSIANEIAEKIKLKTPEVDKTKIKDKVFEFLEKRLKSRANVELELKVPQQLQGQIPARFNINKMPTDPAELKAFNDALDRIAKISGGSAAKEIDITIKVPQSVTESLAKGVIDDSSIALADDLGKSLKSAVSEKFFAKAGAEANEQILREGKYMLKWTNLKSVLRTPFKLSFWTEMGKGLFKGAIANLAGDALAGLVKYGIEKWIAPPEELQKQLESMAGDLSDDDGDGLVDEEICDGITNDKDDRVDEDCYKSVTDMELLKHNTYSIELKKDEFGMKTYTMEKVSNLDTIPSDAERIEECSGAALEQTIEGYLFTLMPDADLLEKSEEQYAIAYYKYFGKYFASAQKRHNVPEALLVTTAINATGMKPGTNYLMGCDVGNAERAEAEQNIECAAEALGNAWNACSSQQGDAQVKCALQGYGKAPNKLNNADYDAMVSTYNKWDSFKVKGAEAS